ncbi:hypothetical protein GGQ02_002867 [Salinibacter ruber]|nr:hypothetical protein [Salinibacter ruber]MCS4050706.1 hypothetical protein [Salinibacter ruber]
MERTRFRSITPLLHNLGSETRALSRGLLFQSDHYSDLQLHQAASAALLFSRKKSADQIPLFNPTVHRSNR